MLRLVKRFIAGSLCVGALMVACLETPKGPMVGAGGAPSTGGAAGSGGSSGASGQSGVNAGGVAGAVAGVGGVGAQPVICEAEAGAGGQGGATDEEPEELAVVQVEAKGFTTCALLNNGRVRCWGENVGYMGYGKSGNDATIGYRETPASVGDIPLLPKAEHIATDGGTGLCTLLSGGRVRCMGGNYFGVLGVGVKDYAAQHASCAIDAELGGEVIALDGGGSFMCGLFSGGNVRCWGGGSDGRLGYGDGVGNNIGDDELPSSMPFVDIGGEVKQLSTGSAHSCAVLVDGRVRCWGANDFGQLGYGNTEYVGLALGSTPAAAGDVDVGGEVVQISAGDSHTCALLGGGRVRCWGYGYYGSLGYANAADIGDNEAPASAGDVDVGGTVVQVEAGLNRSCALLDTGNVRCWGRADGYGIGYGNTDSIGDNETPASAGDIDVGGAVTQITMGASHYCALLETGKVRCWGSGTWGQLGYGGGFRGNVGDDETPASFGDVPVF